MKNLSVRIFGSTAAFSYLTYSVLATACLVAYAMSESTHYGDGPYYAIDIDDNKLIEPGHLFWRPLGHAVRTAFVELGIVFDTLWLLQILSIIFAVAFILILYASVKLICSSFASLISALTVAFSNGVWAYSFSGCSYSASMFFAGIATYWSIKANQNGKLSQFLLAGLLLGLSVAFWGPMVVAGIGVFFLAFYPFVFDGVQLGRAIKPFLAFALGSTISFALPILFVYFGYCSAAACTTSITGSYDGFFEWLAVSGHGISSSGDLLGNSLRSSLGFLQTFYSIEDLGSHLRLWLLGDASPPATVTIFVLLLALISFFLLTIMYFMSLNRVKSEKKPVLILSAFVILINFLFAVTWNGNVLERFYPSLLFFALIVAIIIDEYKLLTKLQFKIVAISIVFSYAGLNWFTGIGAPLFNDSYRQQWINGIAAETNGADGLLVFGNKKFNIRYPHRKEIGRLINLTDVAREAPLMLATRVDEIISEVQGRGGTIYIGGSLLGIDNRPRDGYSFKEFDQPTPEELNDIFSPMIGEIEFTIRGERFYSLKPKFSGHK